MPLVSVIIPTYNRGKILPRCLDSLVKQSCLDFEVIVSDDGSTDDTANVAAAFKGKLQLKYIKGENFGGPARPRNRAIAASSAQYVAFLDSDDWWRPRKLEKCLTSLLNGKDFVYHDMAWSGAKPRQKYKLLRSGKVKGSVFEQILCSGLCIPNSSVVTRRELLQAVGGFSEDKALVAVEDLDCWLKIANLTNRFHRVRGILGDYWSAEDNISEASALQAERVRIVYERHVASLPKKRQQAAWALLNYRAARIYTSCGDIDKAKIHYKAALHNSIGGIFHLKTLWFFVQHHFMSRSS